MSNKAARKFCVLTAGRSGSTSLMNVLHEFPDIGLPDKQIDCPDNELVHPTQLAKILDQYSGFAGRPIADEAQLIEIFFQLNSGSRYAGFKSMPNRHRDFTKFVNREDMTFITVVREDIASTVASLRMAVEQGTWRRAGEAQGHRWTFRREDKSVLPTIVHQWNEQKMVGSVTNAIRLTYEGLCDPNRSEVELNNYFGRTIKIANISPPTQGQDYVTNWAEFKEFVDAAWAELEMRDRHRQ
jgi:hypothetical protein